MKITHDLRSIGNIPAADTHAERKRIWSLKPIEPSSIEATAAMRGFVTITAGCYTRTMPWEVAAQLANDIGSIAASARQHAIDAPRTTRYNVYVDGRCVATVDGREGAPPTVRIAG